MSVGSATLLLEARASIHVGRGVWFLTQHLARSCEHAKESGVHDHCSVNASREGHKLCAAIEGANRPCADCAVGAPHFFVVLSLRCGEQFVTAAVRQTKVEQMMIRRLDGDAQPLR